jgi:hypothetical protein
MQIVLVSKGGAVLEAARKSFADKGIDLIHLTSLSGLFQDLPDVRISGVVVDIRSVVRATEAEKGWLKNMEGIIPHVRVNWHPEEGIRVLFGDAGSSGEEGLSLFLDNCRNIKPRTPRKYRHKERTLHLLFWPRDATAEEARRAYTLNISGGGLFVCTCDEPAVGSRYWVRLPEVDPRPVEVEVKWTAAWGRSSHVPGFGGKFVDPGAEFSGRLAPLLKEE